MHLELDYVAIDFPEHYSVMVVEVKFLTLGMANQTVNDAEKDMTSNLNYSLPGLHTEP